MNLTLKQIRLVKGKTQEEMANLLGIHVQTYRKLEENPEQITIGQAKRIANILQVSYDDIFFCILTLQYVDSTFEEVTQ